MKYAYLDTSIAGDIAARGGYFDSLVEPNIEGDTAREFVDRPLESRGMRATEGFETSGLTPGRSLGVALRIAWRSLVMAGLPMPDVLTMVERVLVHERIEPLFATVCMVVVAPDRRSLRLSLAGHLPPLLLTPGDGHLLSGERLGVPLGVVEGAKWDSLEVPLETVRRLAAPLLRVRRPGRTSSSPRSHHCDRT